MSDLQRVPVADVESYERGIGLSSVVRGTLNRFLPASALSCGVLFWFIGLRPDLTLAEAMLTLGMIIGPLAVGFGMGLEGLRRWLYPDAEVDGRRSVIAGLMSPLVMFIVMTFGRGFSMVEAAALFTLIGMAVAMIMFFAWLTPTPEER